MGSTFETNNILQTMSDRLSSVFCDKLNKLIAIQEGRASTLEGTLGESFTESIQSSTLSSGGLAESNGYKKLIVSLDITTNYDIVITLADGSTFTHNMSGTLYELELEIYQSSITAVSVTELLNTTVRVSINLLSK